VGSAPELTPAARDSLQSFDEPSDSKSFAEKPTTASAVVSAQMLHEQPPGKPTALMAAVAFLACAAAVGVFLVLGEGSPAPAGATGPVTTSEAAPSNAAQPARPATDGAAEAASEASGAEAARPAPTAPTARASASASASATAADTAPSEAAPSEAAPSDAVTAPEAKAATRSAPAPAKTPSKTDAQPPPKSGVPKARGPGYRPTDL
jgi:hypothetical protein